MAYSQFRGRGRLSGRELAALFVEQGGPAKYATMMARLAKRESAGRVKINNRGLNQNGTVDWGLWQINDVWRRDPVVGPLFRSGAILTPGGNAKAAARVLSVQGPKAWATFNPSVDEKFIGKGARRASRLAAGGGGGDALIQAAAGGGAPAGVPQGSDGMVSLLATLGSQQQQPRASAGVQAPSFSAAPSLPSGAQLPASGGGPAPKPDLGALLEAVRTVGGDLPAVPQPAPGAGSGPGGVGAGGGVRLRPGGGYRGTRNIATQLAGIGHELGLKTMSTKRHNTNPYSGSRSDHDYGNRDAFAYDISNGSAPTREMDRTAYRIMRALGDRRYRMGQPIDTGRGVFTIRRGGGTFRVQVIYRGAGEAFGGNHLNHVHLGVKRVG